MEINIITIVASIISFILVFIVDYVDITQYINYTNHIDSAISNTITFISILIGFISSIYIMLQQDKESKIIKLLRKYDLLTQFNKSFKILMYAGFTNVFALIIMNFVASSIGIFKVIVYIAFPITVVFLLSSINIIRTICIIIAAEEKIKSKVDVIEDKNIKL